MNHPETITRDTTKDRLQEEEARLTRDLHEIAEMDPSHPGTYLPKHPEIDNETDDDSSIDSTSASDAAAVIERLQEELRDVKKALESLEKGTYGICKYCKQAIDPKRLEARPASSSCVSCKKSLTQEL